MQRSNLLLLAAVAVGLVIMTVWRLMAEEIVPPNLTGGPPVVTPDDREAPPDRPAAFDGPRVVVTVRSTERYVPPVPARVQAVQLPGRAPLPTTMLAGTGSNPWAEELRPGVALVKVATDGGFLLRQAAVEAIGVTELELGSILTVTVRVQDEAGQPIADAAVSFGELDASGRPVEHVTAAGVVEVGVRSGGGVPLVVRRDGYAATWRPIRVDVDGAREHTVALIPEGRLTFQITGRAERLDLARFFLAPAGGRDAAISSLPLFLQALDNGFALNAQNAGQLGHLPRHGTVAITVMHPLVAIRRHHEVALDGPRTLCTVPLEFAPAWGGAVVDDGGQPLAGVTMLSRPGGRRVQAGSGLLLLPPQLDATGCYYAVSDDGGRFTIARPETGDVLALRAPGHAGRDLEIAAPLNDPLRLPRWRGGDLVLRLLPPVGGVPWRAEFDVSGGTVIDCEPDQPAVVSLPHAGNFDFGLTTIVGEQRAEREHRGVSATGPVDLSAPKIE